MPRLLSTTSLISLSLLCSLAHAAPDAPADASHYLTLYAVPGVPQDDDPYTWSTAGGKQLTTGVTNTEGRAYVKADEGEESYVLKTISMRWQLKVPARCWQGAPDAFQDCVQLGNATSRYDEEQDALKLAQQQKEVQMQERIAAYALAARANDDALAWLGRLPASWTLDGYGARLLSIGDKVAAQIAGALNGGGPDARQFVCRAPADFGPVPDQAAVAAWMALPGDERKVRVGPAWNALVDAGKKGNWMARLELYDSLAGDSVSDLSLLEQYRIVQLMEWLHRKQVGGLYSNFSAAMPDAPGSSRTASWRQHDQASLYAAMLGSYADQGSWGAVLQADPDPALAAAGRSMLVCAKAALPQRQ